MKSELFISHYSWLFLVFVKIFEGPNILFEEKIATAANWIKNSEHLVVLTGAGISTESGLPDFRGIWTLKDKSQLYKALSVNWNKVSPNQGHIALVKLQDLQILKFLISQNIDNLHLKSGIREELLAELHGNITLDRCPQCGNTIKKAWDRPSHCSCGGLYEASIVKFGDKMPEKELDPAWDHAKLADVFMAIGSSLKTHPAGRMPRIAKRNGAKLIIINRDQTHLDGMADLTFSETAGKVLTAIVNYIEKIE